MVKLDGRTKKARLLKARKQRKEIFKRLKQCEVKIDEMEFDKVLKGATYHYFFKSQNSYEEFYGITETGLLNHIRHVYTNYNDYLDILRELDEIPFTYRIKLGYTTETKAYRWIKRKFNRRIEEECKEIFKQFDKWRLENE